MAVLCHARMDLVGGVAALYENDGGSNGEDGVEVSEDAEFVSFAGTVHVHLFYSGNCELMVLEGEGVRIGGELFGIDNDVRGEGSGPEEDLGGFRDGPEAY